MNEKLLKKYLKYAGTDEAFAVLFAKKHIEDTRGHWVDVVDCRRYEMSSDNLHFRFVVGGLYRRKFNHNILQNRNLQLMENSMSAVTC